LKHRTLEEIWSDDLLGRRDDAEFLLRFLTSKSKSMSDTRSYVLNLDARWGYGKTFFLNRLKETIEHGGHRAAYVNAWADDYADDPLLPVVTAIEIAINNRAKVSKIAKSSFGGLARASGQVAIAAGKGVLEQAARRYLGKEALDTFKSVAGEFMGDAAKSATEDAGKKLDELYDAGGRALLDKFKRGKKSIEEFKKQFAEVIADLNESERPLFVLIDELDRCRPTYAVAMLERIKHLFEVKDVVFLIATNTDQLRHSVGALYGAEFDADRYLHRFFDQTYQFEKPQRGRFIEILMRDVNTSRLRPPPGYEALEFIAAAFDAVDLGLRDIQQCLDILSNCVVVWNQTCQIELSTILPLILGQQRRISPSYDGNFKVHLDGSMGRLNWASVKIKVEEAGRNRAQIHTGWQVFEMFSGRAKSQSLFDLSKPPIPDGNLDRWMHGFFLEEARLRFGSNKQVRGNSLLLEYPKLVRSVGRLTPN
jgi:hypothetical protein